MKQYPTLQPIKQTPEQAAENGRKGGIASGKARRRKRDMKQAAEMILKMQTSSGKPVSLEDIKSLSELKGKNVTVEEAMLLAVASRALKGNLGAIGLFMELTGQKPAEKVEMQTTFNDGKLSSILKQLEKDKPDE